MDGDFSARSPRRRQSRRTEASPHASCSERARRPERHRAGDEADGGSSRARSDVGPRAGRIGLRPVLASNREARVVREAVALQRSRSNHLALANYDWAAGDRARGRGSESGAAEVDPQAAAVHRAGAVVSHRQATAGSEPHFKGLPRSHQTALALADYYNGVGRNDEAVRSSAARARSKWARRPHAHGGDAPPAGAPPDALAMTSALVKSVPRMPTRIA